MVCLNGPTAEDTKVTGLTENNMELVYTLQAADKKDKENGLKEKELNGPLVKMMVQINLNQKQHDEKGLTQKFLFHKFF